MNVKSNSYILLHITNNLFTKSSSYKLGFDSLCVLEGTQLGGTSKIQVIKNAVLSYHAASGDNDSYLILGIALSSGRIRILKRYTATSGIRTTITYFQGKVALIDPVIQEGISIDQATPVDLANRYIDISSIVGGNIYYNGVKQTGEYITLSSSDTVSVELELKSDIYHSIKKPIIDLKLRSELFGFTRKGYMASIPYTYNEQSGLITIPACAIFEDRDEAQAGESSQVVGITFTEEESTEYYTYHDNKQVIVKDGFVIKDEMNETLDSGTIQFVNMGGELNIDAFDSIIIDRAATIPNFKRKKQLVDTFVGDICCFNNTLDDSDYQYTVTTFSETKILERFPCPNLAITSPAYSVATYIKEYCRRYVPYIYIYDNNEVKLRPCLKLDPAVLTKFKMTCPEFVWNTPTLREVLTDLFSVADCIPIVKDNVLTYIDLNEKGNPIDTTKLTNRQVSGTSADYCDSLTVPMKNILSNQIIRKTERISLRSNQGEINTSNAIFVTSKPIYNIRKFNLYLDFKLDGDKITEFYDKIELVGYNKNYGIKEKQAYEALLVQSEYSVEELRDKNFLNEQKPFNIYYTRGSNTIEGFSNSIKVKMGNTIGHWTCYAFAMLGYFTSNSRILNYWLASDLEFSGLDKAYEEGGLLNIFAEIEYDTIEETTINISRKNPIKNMQNSLFDTQTANSVDLEHQTIFEYAKINRLSNKIRMIEGTYFDEADIPQLSDYIGEKILFSREISYYDDIIYFKGYIVDNYVLKDYFTGVKSKARSWNIADTNDAINRDDYYKVFIKFGRQSYEGLPLPYFSITSSDPYWDLLNVSSTHTKKDLNHVLCKTFWNDTQYPDPLILSELAYLLPEFQAKYCVMESTQTEYVNSITFNIRFYDNFKFGDIAISNENENKLSKSVRYVNNSGRINKMNIKLEDKIDEGIHYSLGPLDYDFDMDELIEEVTDENDFTETKRTNILTLANYRPVILKDEKATDWIDFEMRFVKDNREIIGSSIQFEYISDDEDIIVNTDFLKSVPISKNTAGGYYAIRVARNHHYKRGDTVAVGDLVTCQLEFDADDESGLIRVPTSAVTIGPNDSWAIGNGLFVNGLQEIYGNICYIRDENVYNNQIDKIKIGTIFDDTETLQAKSEEVGQYVTKVYSLNREINIADCVDFLYDDEIE